MSASRIPKPSGIDIQPRSMDFAYTADTPRYWADGEPYLTHVLNALSLTFPAGERVFIESVRHYRDRIRDPELKAAVRGFIGQEAYHRREHDSFNAWLRQQGLPVDEIYAVIDEELGDGVRQMTPRRRLAFTCALEHFTAIMADKLLSHGELAEQMHESVRMLWIWHAIEETEHKAVAFDLYEHIGGTYAMRVIVMGFVTVNFILSIRAIHRALLQADGQRWNFRSRLRGLVTLWGPRGHFSTLLPAYLDYFRPGFHPWQRDNSALVAKWKKILAERAPGAAREPLAERPLGQAPSPEPVYRRIEEAFQ